MRYALSFQVFHLHLLLGVQDLLCLRFHGKGSKISEMPSFQSRATANFLLFPVIGVPHSAGGDRVRDNRVYLLPPKRRRLPVAMVLIFCGCINCRLRLFVLYLLLPIQDEVSRNFSFFLINMM